MLTTDQTSTLLKVLMIFIENRDPFTIESIVNEIKRSGDMFDGFHDDKGECVVEDYYTDICEVVDEAISNIYKEWVDDLQTVYVYRPAYAHSEDYEDENWDDDYDEIENLDDVNVDKEGNRLPDREEVYDDTKEEEEEDRGAGYYKDPTTGEWMWDRDAAESARYEEGDFENYGNDEDEQIKFHNIPTENDEEYHDPDHPIIYEMKVDKQKRINIKKAIFDEAKWRNEEEVIIIGQYKDHSMFYIARKADVESGEVNLTDEEYIFGDYFLKNGALRIGTTALLEGAETGDIVKAKVIWGDKSFNYINVGFELD